MCLFYLTLHEAGYVIDFVGIIGAFCMFNALLIRAKYCNAHLSALFSTEIVDNIL